MTHEAIVSPPLLRLNDVRVALGRREIVADVTADFRAGEFVVILGPNGAGKSTLLKAIAGILGFRGKIETLGRPMADLNAAERSRLIGYLPQNGGIHWPVPVHNIVALGRMPHGDSDTAIVEQAMTSCDIRHLASQPATDLSGGERTRVLLARLLAVQASIIIADEPVSSLDPAHEIAVMRLLRQEADRGRLVIAVLHDIGLAHRFASRLLALKQGRIVADASPKDILQGGLLDELFGLKFDVASTGRGQQSLVARHEF